MADCLIGGVGDIGTTVDEVGAWRRHYRVVLGYYWIAGNALGESSTSRPPLTMGN